ncbi:hypothetical protein [Brevundimonas intermedia]|uniref:hypothetical protein n=1 Tax=Brevundimonas intermedia TaxID=74315 RepID=UPI001430D908|nr:hypothetical protein [Brevundimonas intermedia]
MALFKAMDHSASNTEARSELLKLIAEAVVEEDDHRRKALLIMADHWTVVLRNRGATLH